MKTLHENILCGVVVSLVAIGGIFLLIQINEMHEIQRERLELVTKQLNELR